MWTVEKPRKPRNEDDRKEQLLLQLHSGEVCSVHVNQNCSIFVHKLKVTSKFKAGIMLLKVDR